jgi:hypothetical protein
MTGRHGFPCLTPRAGAMYKHSQFWGLASKEEERNNNKLKMCRE